ncbi:hypothetical protein BpHYR1_019008 [Brachionus plicatilis]|uniref:Uncharacterized protein n=1 Tax=Brachionus plicatilis TaxID=10195 RepID=A0A3M7RPA4_BRAPC|nr:hypothetical protein BpHYR1_019008 [Brachionus plicatilis]
MKRFSFHLITVERYKKKNLFLDFLRSTSATSLSSSAIVDLGATISGGDDSFLLFLLLISTIDKAEDGNDKDFTEKFSISCTRLVSSSSSILVPFSAASLIKSLCTSAIIFSIDISSRVPPTIKFDKLAASSRLTY